MLKLRTYTFWFHEKKFENLVTHCLWKNSLSFPRFQLKKSFNYIVQPLLWVLLLFWGDLKGRKRTDKWTPTMCCVCVLNHFSCVRLFATLWTVAHQGPLSTGFSRQEYWRGLLCPPPGDLHDSDIKPMSPLVPALQAASFVLLFIFYLKVNCFTEFCCFLSNINMNDP